MYFTIEWSHFLSHWAQKVRDHEVKVTWCQANKKPTATGYKIATWLELLLVELTNKGMSLVDGSRV